VLIADVEDAEEAADVERRRLSFFLEFRWWSSSCRARARFMFRWGSGGAGGGGMVMESEVGAGAGAVEAGGKAQREGPVKAGFTVEGAVEGVVFGR
jgi:hypothetical protein